MINTLSTTKKIAILILLPISWFCITGINRMVDFGNVWFDVVFNLATFFLIPYIFVRASLPIVAFFEVMFKKPK